MKIRPDMPLDKAALIGCGVTTGVGAVLNTAQVRPGETVAVIGCGGIGLNAIQAAAIVGAGRVIAIDRVASKLELAKTFGATDVVDASETDAVLAVHRAHRRRRRLLVRGDRPRRPPREQAFNMLRKGGTATVIGMIPFGEQVEIDGFQLLLEKKLQGSNMGSNRFRIDMPQYVDWYLAGKLKLDELVSAVMPLSEDQRRVRRARGWRGRPPARDLRLTGDDGRGVATDYEDHNRRFWDVDADAYQSIHGGRLADEPLAWGVWRIPEADVGALDDVRDRDVLELGCGAAQWTGALDAVAARAPSGSTSRRRSSATAPAGRSDWCRRARSQRRSATRRSTWSSATTGR